MTGPLTQHTIQPPARRRSHPKGHSPLVMIIMLLIMAIAMPQDLDAARKKKRTKAKTTATTTRKKTSSKKRTTRKRKTSSGSGGANWALTASDVNPDSESPEAAPVKKKSTKRQVTVERPDLEVIRQATLDPQNPMYFPKLMAKYNRNDTTMTADEYRHLYLGYMFQEDYDPYRESPYSSVTEPYRNKASHSKEEIDTIRKYAELTLKDNPFDLRQMSFLVHVLKERRKDMSAKIWEYRLEHLLGAIKSTGTGEDQENAWFVIYPAHEYDMVQLLGYQAVDADFIDDGFDYLTVEPEPETAKRLRDKVQKGFWFDVRQIQQQYDLKHPGEEEEVIEEDAGELDPDDIPAEADPDEVPAEAADPDDIPAEE